MFYYVGVSEAGLYRSPGPGSPTGRPGKTTCDCPGVMLLTAESSTAVQEYLEFPRNKSVLLLA